MAQQSDDPALAELFAPLAKELADQQEKILQDLIDCQGSSMDIGGYYYPDPELAEEAMRPSATLNEIIDTFAP